MSTSTKECIKKQLKRPAGIEILSAEDSTKQAILNLLDVLSRDPGICPPVLKSVQLKRKSCLLAISDLFVRDTDEILKLFADNEEITSLLHEYCKYAEDDEVFQQHREEVELALFKTAIFGVHAKKKLQKAEAKKAAAATGDEGTYCLIYYVKI